MSAVRVLFLDMDGTVRKGPAELAGKFVNSPSDVDVFDGVADIIKSYKERGWKVVGISNQGGVALGHVSDQEVARSMQETNRQCANLFDGMLWCPHHPDIKSGDADTVAENQCLCRKPRIGNVVRALVNFHNQGLHVISSKCLFVGDLEDDKQTAANANMQFMWASDWRRKGPITD